MKGKGRLLGTMLGTISLLGGLVVGALDASAARPAKHVVRPHTETCFFVCPGDGFKTYTIGVDALNPPGKNFEYTDFFPRGVKPSTTLTTGATPSLTVRNGDVLHFRWTPQASPDSAHTATLVAQDESLATAQNKYSPLQPDPDDGTGKFIANPLTFAPTDPTCGTPDSPCLYDGTADLNSGFKVNVNGTNNPSEFFVELDLDLGETSSTTVHFFCALHPGMVGQARVVSENADTATTTEAQAAADALAQYTTETAAGVAAETAANQTSVTNNADGTKNVTMTAGTGAPHVEVLEMLPNNVSIKAGDKVTWVDKGFDIHTVTFPKGSGSDAADPFRPPVCEGSGTTDNPAPKPNEPPAFGCSSPAAAEQPIELGPVGPTSIASTSTVASSGIILAAAAGAPFPDRYSFTFPNAGTFAYMCRIHDNMTGTIMVAAQPAAAPVALPLTGGGGHSGIPIGFLLVGVGALLSLLGGVSLRLSSFRRS
jgi:plastocyanin